MHAISSRMQYHNLEHSPWLTRAYVLRPHTTHPYTPLHARIHPRPTAVHPHPFSTPFHRRTFLLLVSRYITLSSGLFGMFNLIKSKFFNFYLPEPCMVVAGISQYVALSMYVLIAYTLWRFHEPWKRWVSVFAFTLVSWVYFFVQLSLIAISIVRLTCCASKEIKWNPTGRGKGSTHNEALTSKTKAK